MSKKVQFALFSPQAGQSWHQLEDRAHRCEKLGFHSIWLVDHMWTRGMPELDHHECMALMAGLSAKTEKIRIGTMVICNSYRNPALLAKSLATIDHISNGRLEIGYGAGWMDEEYKAYGYQFPSMGTRLKMFEEGLHIIKAMFTEKRATYKGRHYAIEEALCNPKPVQQPHPPITIGGMRRQGDVEAGRPVRRPLELSGRLRKLRAQVQRAQAALQGRRARPQHHRHLGAVAGLHRPDRRGSGEEVADGADAQAVRHDRNQGHAEATDRGTRESAWRWESRRSCFSSATSRRRRRSSCSRRK